MKNPFANFARRNIYSLAAVLVFAVVGTIALGIIHASGTATMTLSPGSSTVSLGTSVTVTILENSGSTPVNAVEADLTYDQTKFQFVSIDTSTSAFPITANSTGGSGSVQIAAGTSTPVTGQQTIAKVTFTAIGVGGSPVAFANTSQVIASSGGTDDTGVLTGATYTVADTTAPSKPAGLTASSRGATSIGLSWTASTDNVAVTGYRIYRGGTQVGTSSTTSYTDSGLTPSNSYSYTVAAVDAAGNVSTQSTALATSTTADTSAPSTPTGLTQHAHSLTSITVDWTAATDNVDVTGYRIYRNGTQVGTSVGNTYTDNGLAPGTSYSYTIAAYDAAGNVSAQSAASSFSTLVDAIAPSVPGSLSPSGQTATSVSLSWTASTDNVAVTGYRIYRGGTQVGTSATASFTDTGLTPGTGYSYTVAAYDASGNISAQSSAKSVSTVLVTGDVNGDGHVNISDLSVMAATWQSTTDLRADLNHDGVVGIADLSILAAHWGS